MSSRRRSFWGWGWEGEARAPEFQRLGALVAQLMGVRVPEPTPPPTVDEVGLGPCGLKLPSRIAAFCTTEPYERLAHTYGKALRDVLRALHRDFASAPDCVALPADEDELARLLDWCQGANVAAIPYGGGSSVVGGVEPAVGTGYAGTVSIDLRRFGGVLEIDATSRAARIQAGIYGPALEAALKPHGLSLRHYPQSFEFSTLGGWIATRSGGHYATLHTHIDDFVASLRVLTPKGVLETRRLPASGAGPDPNRLYLGSEGTLGIVTEAWMRLQARPRYRSSASVRFGDFLAAARAVRALAQSGLNPANCRLLDALEARDSGLGDGRSSVLLLGFESPAYPVESAMQRALECCGDHGGSYDPARVKHKAGDGERTEEADAWRNAFFRAPYLRDALATLGILVETFETAVTWDRFEAFHGAVLEAARGALDEICGPGGWVSCRFTHVYPDGVAPYYTIKAPGRKGEELEQWDRIKAAVSDVLIREGGTITHHHAVGRDHRPWYEQERPPLYAAAFVAAKSALDPAGIMNPGVLMAPPGA